MLVVVTARQLTLVKKDPVLIKGRLIQSEAAGAAGIHCHPAPLAQHAQHSLCAGLQKEKQHRS
jgi:hypothetical protein